MLCRFGRRLWSQCKRCRKSHRCVCCGKVIAVGVSAFRPLDNGVNRHDRICSKCGSERRVY